jgi:hypothetical protein
MVNQHHSYQNWQNLTRLVTFLCITYLQLHVPMQSVPITTEVRCEFKSRALRSILNTTLCDKVYKINHTIQLKYCCMMWNTIILTLTVCNYDCISMKQFFYVLVYDLFSKHTCFTCQFPDKFKVVLDFKIIRLSNILAFSVPDEGYSRDVLCAKCDTYIFIAAYLEWLFSSR